MAPVSPSGITLAFCILASVCIYEVQGHFSKSSGTPKTVSLNVLRKNNGKLGNPAGEWHHAVPKDEWFTQKLDHFNDADTTTWQQVSVIMSVLVFNTYPLIKSLKVLENYLGMYLKGMHSFSAVTPTNLWVFFCLF